MGELPSNVPPAEKMRIYFSKGIDPSLSGVEEALNLADRMVNVPAFFQTQNPGNRNIRLRKFGKAELQEIAHKCGLETVEQLEEGLIDLRAQLKLVLLRKNGRDILETQTG